MAAGPQSNRMDSGSSRNSRARSSPWAINYMKGGAQIAAMGTGTFFGAKTGLLDDKTAATHWGVEDYFREGTQKSS